MSLLVVEDNPVQVLVLRQALTDQEFKVDVICDGAEVLKLHNLASYELILLDLGLPNIDGLTLLRHFRASGLRVPVLVLSCQETVDKRIEALQAGADDYLCKPFAVTELLARIRAILRRPSLQTLKLRVADLELDCIQRTVRRGGVRIHLGRREFALLECLMRNAGSPVSRALLLDHIWKGESITPLNLEVCINRLRNKLDEGRDTGRIRTVRGTGYTMTCQRQAITPAPTLNCRRRPARHALCRDASGGGSPSSAFTHTGP